jgi:hypothetical protein
MFTPEKLRELARACRAFAFKLEKDSENQKGTSAYQCALLEIKQFRELAAECEALAKGLR